MAELNFTVEFHDNLDEGLPESVMQITYDGLEKITRGNDDISHALVNFKQPAHGRESSYVYEVTIRLYMDGEDVVVTEKGQILDGTLREVLDVTERQVNKQREKKRGD